MPMNSDSTTRPYPATGTKLSISAASIEVLRLGGMIYVDKTDMILDLVSHYKKVFLTRPRRSGKTLLVSTMESLFQDNLTYFKGNRRIYRDGRYIEAPFKLTERWNEPTYAVVRLDFSFMGVEPDNTLEERFRMYVKRVFGRIGFTPKNGMGDGWTDELRDWLCQPGRAPIVLLVDEYDAGIGSRLDDPEGFSLVLSLLSSFFNVVQETSAVWRFVFVTGIIRLDTNSMLPALNYFEDITFNPSFGSLLGFTEQEIRENYHPYLEKAATQLDTDVDGVLNGIRRHYGGLCFDNKNSSHMHAPWSVLRFFRSSACGFERYWSKTGGSISVLRRYLESNRTAFKVMQPESAATFDDLASVMSMKAPRQELLLYQAGYLSIIGIRNGDAVLGTPNLELAGTLSELYMEDLLPWDKREKEHLPDVPDTLESGSPDAWVSLVNQILSLIPYASYPIDDASSCRALVQMIVLGVGYGCDIERLNVWDRSDLEVCTQHTYWLMEFSCADDGGEDQDTAEKKALLDAVKKIRDKTCARDVTGLTLIRIAIVFSKHTRQIRQWKIVPIDDVAGSQPVLM